ITRYIPLFEDMEQGSPLSFNIPELPSISKLCSRDNFNNKLWITHDSVGKSLTFEEIIDNFSIWEDKAITQVVHLEYDSKNTDFIITHLDHEYIFYTLDEYDEKLNNYSKKGHTKIKSFKIDKARIPFYYKYENEYFLYQIFDAYLKNKNLISEYFNDI
ncbi:hypothetical protein ACK4QA_19600, partial [Proteus mirabilis]